jgi:hypothetical protein
MITELHNFNVDKTNENIQMELAEMRWNSVVRQKFSEVAVPNFVLIYLRIDFQNVFNLHAKMPDVWQYLRK